MTLTSSISKLTTSVDQLTGAANVTKAALDAKVAQADAEVVAVQAEQAMTEAVRDEVATQAATAATHLATVKAGVTYQGISAILAEKAVTAVDVFVYDTSLDSDGGAWRKRCQHTSWYTEPIKTDTRGARREFPAVAVIVATTGSVTIYDGDDPSLPMWMVFGLGVGSLLTSFNSVSMRNGIMCAGSPASINFSGLLVARFLNDDAISVRGHVYWNLHMNVPAISARNGTWQQAGARGFLAYASSSVLVNPSVNDVAMTVLPDAPIDSATGLPVPTIAVATAGGVSVIHDDGNVWDITNYAQAPATVEFGDIAGTQRIITQSRYTSWSIILDIPTADIPIFTQYFNRDDGSPLIGIASHYASTGDDILVGKSTGLVRVLSEPGLVGRDILGPDLRCDMKSTYNTGWMPGDIKGAFLSDTDDTDLVGSGELVTNGAFDTNLTGWIDSSVGGADVNASTGSAVFTTIDGSKRANLDQSFVTEAGKTYVISVDITASDFAQCAIWVGTFQSSANLVQIQNLGVGAYTRNFVAAGASSWVRLTGTFNTGSATFDNVSVRLVDADRSVANRGLIVNGTITRSPVADGAELVAYSGFSAANYLEQPYNSALDFGTGDFSIMGWVKQSSIAANQVFLAKANAAGTSVFSFFTYVSSGNLGYFHPTSGAVSSGKALALNAWNHIGLVRKSGIVTFFINGVAVFSSTPAAFDLTRTNDDVLRLGRDFSVNVGGTSALTLWRISASAPTADQIKKIYEDERKLFQPAAQCTLYGTSDAVTCGVTSTMNGARRNP